MRGTNRLGAWSNRSLVLAIHALPSWYETWWFRAAIVALLLLVAYGVYRLRTSMFRRRQYELESIVGDRTRELSAANDKLHELSLNDPLTGLRNRRFLAQHLDAEVALTLRRYDDWHAAPLGEPPGDADLLFFLVDLDQFKEVNDRFGHQGGDAALMQMRDRLEEVFRSSDFIARWGGDEFLAVARGSRRDDAPEIAERIRAAVEGRPFILNDQSSLTRTASVGFAAFPFVPATPGALSWTQVVALADQALYMAKNGGRNTWCGVLATTDTDAAALVSTLAVSPEEAVRANTHAIFRPR